MFRIFLEYKGDQIALADGEHLIGRGLSCTIRLNDLAVSREHVRLEVKGGEIRATDLNSRNGSLINGRALSAGYKLQHGDVLRMGGQLLRIRVEQPTALTAHHFDEETVDRRFGAAGNGGPRTRRPTPDRLTAIDDAAEMPLSVPNIDAIDCPKCRERVPAERQSCPRCGHTFPRGGPLYTTQILDLKTLTPTESGAERRLDPRIAVELLLLYVSESLSLNAMARDLSLGGVFVATDLLDEVGTACDITFLPEARPAVQCRGMVRHVSKTPSSDGKPAGMGIQFTHLGLGGREWLSTLIKTV